MRRPRALEHEMAVGGGAGLGDQEQGPLPTPDRARRPASLRRRTARRAFPRSLRRAPGHKGLEGKHGARPTSSERLLVRSGLARTVGAGAGAGLTGTARWGAWWGVVLRSFPSPRPPSTVATAQRAMVGPSGSARRRRRARSLCGEGRAPPFSLALPDCRDGCGGSEWWPLKSEAFSPQIFSSVRAPERGS